MTDELNPVRCGCGGKPVVGHIEKTNYLPKDRWYIGCPKCDICTGLYDTEAEVVESWNRAMGAGKDEIAITKGYWMETYDGLHCSVCNYKCETTALPEVCPHCGTRLTRW